MSVIYLERERESVCVRMFCVYVCMYVYYVCMYLCMYVYVYMCVCTYVYYIHYVCVYVCVYTCHVSMHATFKCTHHMWLVMQRNVRVGVGWSYNSYRLVGQHDSDIILDDCQYPYNEGTMVGWLTVTTAKMACMSVSMSDITPPDDPLFY